jgi:hypothetical protein
MNLDTLFTLLNTAVLPFWALLMIAPRWVWTDRLTHSVVIVSLYAPVYLWLLATAPGGEGDFSSLDGVAALFTDRQAVLAGWIHYLVFDLFVGAWIARDAVRRGIHPLFVFPCLVLTLMLGPVGLGSYAALRGAMRRTGTLVEGAAT